MSLPQILLIAVIAVFKENFLLETDLRINFIAAD